MVLSTRALNAKRGRRVAGRHARGCQPPVPAHSWRRRAGGRRRGVDLAHDHPARVHWVSQVRAKIGSDRPGSGVDGRGGYRARSEKSDSCKRKDGGSGWSRLRLVGTSIIRTMRGKTILPTAHQTLIVSLSSKHHSFCFGRHCFVGFTPSAPVETVALTNWAELVPCWSGIALWRDVSTPSTSRASSVTLLTMTSPRTSFGSCGVCGRSFWHSVVRRPSLNSHDVLL